MEREGLAALLERMDKLVASLDLHGRVTGLEVSVEHLETRLDKFEAGQERIAENIGKLRDTLSKIVTVGGMLLVAFEVAARFIIPS